jgi:hypothetical protein
MKKSERKNVAFKSSLFGHVISCIEDNNRSNDAQWKDWKHAGEPIDLYKSSWKGEISSIEEETLTYQLIDRIIKTNGKSKNACIKKYNLEIWGINFTSNK